MIFTLKPETISLKLQTMSTAAKALTCAMSLQFYFFNSHFLQSTLNYVYQANTCCRPVILGLFFLCTWFPMKTWLCDSWYWTHEFFAVRQLNHRCTKSKLKKPLELLLTLPCPSFQSTRLTSSACPKSSGSLINFRNRTRGCSRCWCRIWKRLTILLVQCSLKCFIELHESSFH